MHLTTNGVLKILAIISADGFTLLGAPFEKIPIHFLLLIFEGKNRPNKEFFSWLFSVWGSPLSRRPKPWLSSDIGKSGTGYNRSQQRQTILPVGHSLKA